MKLSRTVWFPLAKMLSKAFCRPWETPEYSQAICTLDTPSSVASVFHDTRLGLIGWTEYGMLPPGLTKIPPYWSVPWAEKVRPPITAKQLVGRRLLWSRTLNDFGTLCDDMRRCRNDGWWPGPAVQAILLEDWNQRQVAIFTDGNRRIGIAAALGWKAVPLAFTDERTFDLKQTRSASTGRFSRADTERWWFHAFRRVYDA